MWLFKKIEARIGCMCHRWLSIECRLVLLKSVLESVPVYWLSLAHVPKSILEKNQECASLVKWNTLAKPKNDGGWGLKNIYLFDQALVTKSLWWLLFNEGLWGKIMQQKHLKSLTLEQWIRCEPKSIWGASNIWKRTVCAFHVLGYWVAWKIGGRTRIRLGEDPWVGAFM